MPDLEPLPSRWRELFLLLRGIDAEIARVYGEQGVELNTRFVAPILLIARNGPATIAQLAAALDVSHSAGSQTITAMRREGLVRTVPGPDGRTRTIRLTAAARRLVPLLEAEWSATEAVLAELEAECPYPLSTVARDLSRALARRGFLERLQERLA